MPAPRARRRASKALVALLVLAAIAATPVTAGSGAAGWRGMPRHPASLSSMGIVTLNSTRVVSYLTRLAEALSSNARLVMLRSTVVHTSKSIAREAGEALGRGIVVDFAIAEWAGNSGVPPLLVGVVDRASNRTTYYLDAVGADMFILDTAAAVYRGDYEAYMRASAAALKYYELLTNSSTTYAAPEGVMVGIPVLEEAPSRKCELEVNTTLTLLLTGGSKPSLEALLDSLPQWHYATRPLLGAAAGLGCMKTLNTSIALVSSTYVNSYIELLAYAMALIASLQPVSPSMNEFVVVQVANLTGSQGVQESPREVRLPEANASQASPLSEGGLRILGDIERKLLHKGIPSGFIAPPRGGGGNATVYLGGGSGIWAAGIKNLMEGLGGLSRIGIPSLLKAPATPRLSLIGASTALRVGLLGALAVIAAYILYREGVFSGVKRIALRARIALVMRASRMRLPKSLPGPVRCYIYALKLSSSISRPKRVWETPREYLNSVLAKLPFKVRRVLMWATRVYEEYRYSPRKSGGEVEC